MPMRRIGLLGGTFDPVHLAHVQLAQDACAALALDEVWFVIAAQPWQKQGVSPAVHRLAMLEAALTDAADAHLRIEPMELTRQGASYTIDTLIALRARLGVDVALVWLMGADQWRNLPTWHRHTELLEYASIAVAQRASPAGDLADQPKVTLPPALPITQPSGQVVSFSMAPHPASATDIRAEGGRGGLARDWLSPRVHTYIQQHHLYDNR